MTELLQRALDMINEAEWAGSAYYGELSACPWCGGVQNNWGPDEYHQGHEESCDFLAFRLDAWKALGQYVDEDASEDDDPPAKTAEQLQAELEAERERLRAVREQERQHRRKLENLAASGDVEARHELRILNARDEHMEDMERAFLFGARS